MAAVPLYGVTIHRCCARGDLDEMRELEQQAREHLSTYGNMPVAYELLQAEIAKAEEAASSS
jgi:hypothetical protein